MTADPLLTLFLPIALGIIMLGLGLSLTLADFARVVKFPKPVLIGLACQLLLLPLVCFFLAKAFGLAPAACGWSDAPGPPRLAAPRPISTATWRMVMWR